MATITLKETLGTIAENNPILGDFLVDKTTLGKHSKKLFEHTFNPIHLERQKRYKEIIKGHVDKIFKNDTHKPKLFINGEGLIVSTADHHGIHNYPPSISGHLATMLSTITERETKGDLLFLDASKVPLNEIGHRRGIDFHGKHINLFPKSDKHKVVYNYPKQNISITEKIADSKSTTQFSEEELEFLKEIDNIIGSIDFSSCDNFSEQIVKINFALWPLMFSEDVRDSIRIPVTVAHDIVLSEYLVSDFLKSTSTDNFVYRGLFDPLFRGRVLDRFRGHYGCWEEDQNVGTHFFWYLQDGEPYSMWLNDDYLVSYDENEVELIRLPFTPEAIAAALKNKLLVANIFLKFSLVSTWMGMKMMGGPNQINFSTEIKRGWLDLLRGKEKQLVLTTETKGLSFINGLVGRNTEGNLYRMNFLDACYEHTIDPYYIDHLKKVTVQEAELPTVDINYIHSVPPFERQAFGFDESELFKGFTWILNR